MTKRAAPRTAFKKGHMKPPNSGRKPGVQNKVTRDVKEMIRCIVENKLGELEQWISRVQRKNPAKAALLLTTVMEYHVPKLQRTEHVGDNGDPLLLATTLAAQIAAAADPAQAQELYRRLMRGEPLPQAATPPVAH